MKYSADSERAQSSTGSRRERPQKSGSARAIKQARRLLTRRRFTEAISFLEPQVFLFRENIEYFAILGLACLYTGDLGGAHSYLQRAHSLDQDDVRVANALAYTELRRRRPKESLRLWLDILDSDPKDKVAIAGLNLLRRNPTLDGIDESSAELRRLRPRLPSRLPRVAASLTLVLSVAAALFFAVPWAARVVASLQHDPRPGVEALDTVAGIDAKTASEGSFHYVLSSADVQRTVDAIRRHFNAFEDNLARREMNRILLSNASMAVQETIRALIPSLRTPDFTNFAGEFSYQDVIADVPLYEGCYVRWAGRVSNLRSYPDRTTFDLLVGYEDQETLEGVVATEMMIADPPKRGQAIEVIGEVRAIQGVLNLRITSIRPLEP